MTYPIENARGNYDVAQADNFHRLRQISNTRPNADSGGISVKF